MMDRPPDQELLAEKLYLLRILVIGQAEGLHAHDTVLHVVGGLPNLRAMARVNDVQQAIGTEIARSTVRR